MWLLRVAEWGGATAGVTGTLLLATNKGFGAEAFWCYAVANVLWLAYSYAEKQKGMLAMNGIYSVISIIGIANHA